MSSSSAAFGGQTGPESAKLAVSVSQDMALFLAEKNCSILMSAYKANKLIALKLNEQCLPCIEERTFETCMGLAYRQSELLVATNHQVWRLCDYSRIDAPIEKGGKYAPQKCWVTGDVKCHDLAFDSHSRPIFVNTMFSCICRVSDQGSFEVIWAPPFVSDIKREDCCHLNGMATENGKAKFATAVAATDTKMAWRDHLHDGGVVIDVESNDIIVRGLSMPHSPRLHQGRLWLLNSGTGEFGYVDPNKGKFEAVLACPGFPRGLSFIDDYAVIGTSNYRDERLFHGLPIEETLKKNNKKPVAGVIVVNLKTGAVEHQLIYNNLIQELYDVAIVNDPSPAIFGLQGDDLKWMYRVLGAGNTMVKRR